MTDSIWKSETFAIDDTHRNESIAQCQVVRLTNRPKKLSKEASLPKKNYKFIYNI